jgi:hypothetical protein
LVIPANPTNADLALSITQLHACVEQQNRALLGHVKKTNAALKATVKAREVIVERLDGLGDVVETLAANQNEIKTQLGVGNKKKPLAFIGQTRLVMTLFGAATAAGGLWRFLEFMAPSIAAVFHQVHLYVLK